MMIKRKVLMRIPIIKNAEEVVDQLISALLMCSTARNSSSAFLWLWNSWKMEKSIVYFGRSVEMEKGLWRKKRQVEGDESSPSMIVRDKWRASGGVVFPRKTHTLAP